ncbi:MAG TPA: hypothetical protein VN734_06360 [Acidobacteriaceae bacterium]|nr:hypothetical protein [Acidobacteriaceae bacterium]
MAKRARLLFLCTLLLSFLRPSFAVDARFDLVGPRINVRVTRNGVTLPISEVPNLQPGDRIWLHPDLPPTQSVKYLLICVFLRGNTNPPPEDWFTRIETWQKNVREEGVFVTVPREAQQAVLFLAPETGGDFSTLKSAVRGRPGIFVRASQDLAEAGFEQSRIEKYLTDIRRVPLADANELQKHSDLLARTLALKPNEACFQQPVDMQFTCLTQTGSQSLLDDGHGQSIAAALSNGPNSDLIAAASYTALAGGGLYSAYVGAVVDLVRVMANIHTAQYQYIPAIAFPQNDAMNLRLNTPPSFHNPKSVLVIGLPAVQSSPSPPLRPADPKHVACLIQPSVTLPIEGAPLVFSTALAHDIVLHLNTPPGSPHEPDIPLVPDAYQGGLVLQRSPEHHVLIHDVLHDRPAGKKPSDGKNSKPAKPQPEPIRLTGTIQGQWGFDSFTGPTVPLQQLPGGDWQIATGDASADTQLIAGKSSQLFISSTGSACVHTITAEPRGSSGPQNIAFKPAPTPEQPNLLALTLPLEKDITPGDLHLSILQYGQPKADDLSARTFAEPAHIDSTELHAADRTILLTGLRLNQIERLALGDLNFRPLPPTAGDAAEPAETSNSLRLSLPPDAPAPPTKVGDHLTAKITLHDGRTLSVPVVVSAARPSVTLLSKSFQPSGSPAITLSSADDLPLSASLTFTLKTAQPFPRSGRVEVETIDGTLRSVLTLAPSGGLVLQDPHTVVATLDPLRSFGPSAFGALHLRAIFPPPRKRGDNGATANPANTTEDDASSDWLPLGTLVRLPQLSTLQCPPDPASSCTLSGSSLYLIDAIAPTPAFDNPSRVPDGYTGATLSVPHPAAAGTLFLKLRDDPNPVNAANIPSPAPPPRPVATARARRSSSAPAAASSTSADAKSDKSDRPDKSDKPDKSDSPRSDSTRPSDSTTLAPDTRARKDGDPQDTTTTPAAAPAHTPQN